MLRADAAASAKDMLSRMPDIFGFKLYQKPTDKLAIKKDTYLIYEKSDDDISKYSGRSIPAVTEMKQYWDYCGDFNKRGLVERIIDQDKELIFIMYPSATVFEVLGEAVKERASIADATVALLNINTGITDERKLGMLLRSPPHIVLVDAVVAPAKSIRTGTRWPAIRIDEHTDKIQYIINLYSPGFDPKLRCQHELPNNALFVDHMHLKRFVQLLAGKVVNKDWNLDYNENLDSYRSRAWCSRQRSHAWRAALRTTRNAPMPPRHQASRL